MSGRKDWTRYSDVMPGDPGNHRWTMRLDLNDRGYLGINQTGDGALVGRILLSPAQVRALMGFVVAKGMVRRRRSEPKARPTRG